MKHCQISGSCHCSQNKKQLANLDNFRGIQGRPQGYYTLFADNSARFAEEMSVVKLREIDSFETCSRE